MVTGKNGECVLCRQESLHPSILTETEQALCTWLIFAHPVAGCGPAPRGAAVWTDHVHFATWPIKTFMLTYIRAAEFHQSYHFLVGLAKTVHLWSGWTIISSTCLRVLCQFFSQCCDLNQVGSTVTMKGKRHWSNSRILAKFAAVFLQGSAWHKHQQTLFKGPQ